MGILVGRRSFKKAILLTVALGVLSFVQESMSAVESIEGSTRSTVQKTKAVHISYRSKSSLYKKLHKKCSNFFRPKRMIADEDLRKFYSVEIVSVMPKQKTATALCVSKMYKNDDVVAVRKTL